MNVYRWARCGRSKRPNHGPKHSGQRWTWGVSAVIAVLSWALRRFRQMDTMQSSLKLLGTTGFWSYGNVSFCPNHARAIALQAIRADSTHV